MRPDSWCRSSTGCCSKSLFGAFWWISTPVMDCHQKLLLYRKTNILQLRILGVYFSALRSAMFDVWASHLWDFWYAGRLWLRSRYVMRTIAKNRKKGIPQSCPRAQGLIDWRNLEFSIFVSQQEIGKYWEKTEEVLDDFTLSLKALFGWVRMSNRGRSIPTIIIVVVATAMAVKKGNSFERQ